MELLEKYSLLSLSEKLSLHVGTLKRWVEKREVPINYYNDLNSLLGEKYVSLDSYRAKDQFFTDPEIAKYCYKKVCEVLDQLGISLANYTFIEPSAGCCSFFDLLPQKRRIGIDIEPKGKSAKELIKKDYLDFYPKSHGKYIVIGNPPFGLRGNMALRFINHSREFADFVAFILPPLFDSTGKGVPMKRVLGYKLIHSERLPLDSYHYPNGNKLCIATIFQIWSKYGTINLAEPKINNYQTYFRIYSLSNGSSPSSKRNVIMIDKCDAYLPSTCFSGMKLYKSFSELPNKRGYGIKILKNYEKIIGIISSIDWKKVAFLSTNSAINLRTDLIVNELIRKGAIQDEKTKTK